jgi:dihydropteroate synthase
MRVTLDCGGRPLDLSRPQVMGILNVTPDSFSDGGLFIDRSTALAQARQMVAEGAGIIDVGGESTRPGAADVCEDEELARVIPVIEAIAGELDVIISIDTSKAAVMTEAVKAGAGMINDVRALREPGALQAARAAAVPVCLMHMLGEPRTMQANPHYADVVTEVMAFLAQRIHACEQAGITADQLIIDPGFGFGKTVAHNLELVRRLREFTALGRPILMGVSRKSTLGAILGRPVDERLIGSVTLAALCARAAANIVRVHDVAATVDALKVCQAVDHPDRYEN